MDKDAGDANRTVHDSGKGDKPLRSEEKDAQDALVESERKYRMLAENSRDMIWVADTALNVTYASSAAAPLLGYPIEELLTMNMRSLVTPASWREVQVAIQSAFDKPGNSKVTLELEHVRKDGARFWGEVVAASLLNSSRQVTGFQGSTRDITRRKANQQEILLLRRAVEDATDGIVVAEPDGTVIFQNGAFGAMLGFPTAQDFNAGGGIWAVAPEHGDIEAVLRALRAGEPYQADLVLRRSDGTAFDAHVRVNPVRDEEGRISALMAIVSDISAQKRAEAERRALEQRVTQGEKLESLGLLAGGIAHDFNNLLMSILGNAELVQDDLPADSPTREMLRDIMSSARRASELSRQMLAYSGHGVIQKRPLDLNALLQEIRPLVEATMAPMASLELNLTPGLPSILADHGQLSQAILRLAANASEALDDASGTIKLATGAQECDSAYLYEIHMGQVLRPGQYVYLDISDSGCGIPEEIRSRIFDPFFTTKFTGRGLGLSMVHGVVRGHQGTIKVESAPGKGSVFRLLFPASDTVATPQPAACAPTWGAGKLLVIDDEGGVRRVTRRNLERMGFTVVEAVDGEEGLRAFRAEPDAFRCVLLDLMMPGLRGDEVLAAIRALRPTQPVILVSGYSETEIRAHYQIDGADSLLLKPFRREQLEQALRAVFTPEDSA